MKDIRGKMMKNKWQQVIVSDMARETFNPIRNILETMQIVPNPNKPMISLSIGDPTTFGNLKPADSTIRAVAASLASGKYNGYAPSTGYLEARAAVAEHVSTETSQINADDVILCSGCSCSLDICISALANPGQNILLPRPGFPLYKTLANGLGIQTKEYNLLAQRRWEVDLEHLESLIDEKTACILINNPSNPCGSVFSRKHLKEILLIAERNQVPIIADEIYEHFIFEDAIDREYIPIASLTTTVPVLSCGGLTKRYLVPGWRLGWITIHDRNNIFQEAGIINGLRCLSQRIIGSNTIVQGALPEILRNTPKAFFHNTLKVVENNAKYAHKRLSAVHGLHPVMPDGAMYMMVAINVDTFPIFRNNSLAFVEGLVKEQSVFCLPGQCFNIDNYFRIVLTLPKHLMEDACERIAQFCQSHAATQIDYNLVAEEDSKDFTREQSVSLSSSTDDLDHIVTSSCRGISSNDNVKKQNPPFVA